MADEVCNQIDETIKNFTDEKIGSISEFQRITDEASNKQYYNDTYQNFRYTCDSLHDLKYPIEDLVNDSISDEDAELVVTKLEELISAEKPLFDHFHTYYNYQTEVFYPWKNISPTGDTSPECYEPGHFPDLFDYHNLAWKVC
ncbi:uncharacterized protein APUU_71184A [Aspergillus puulaauensis]|uniref:Uncharacterized protein n=1 Tax=Aspergillus puulaauensis TaxID=1220207 RepID=A0A7R7XY08_9EURO|nr:uncharacterized protein APUU_71184A [Aspergillus puulaauensis]BCS29614.1 hypothetical protein APUU_71184A [Aspergillus puulaauensis]